MYGRRNDSGRDTLRMHLEQFPDRRIPNDWNFQSYIVNFVKQVFSTTADTKLVEEALYAVQALKESIFNFVADRTKTSARAVADNVGVSQQTV